MILTKPINARFDDQQQERVRANFEQRITELQSIAVTDDDRSGAILGRLVLTGSGTTTLPEGTTRLDVEQVGGGGGGGGGAGGAGVGVGGGGGSGVYLGYSIPVTDLRISWSAGAAGAGGSNAGGNGGTGGDSILTVDGANYLAKGGTGGLGGPNVAGPAGNIGGQPGAGSYAADKVAGSAGLHGILITGVFFSGAGGSNPMGGGGAAGNGGTAGQNALGPGGGGSGAAATAAGLTGGTGGAGKFILIARRGAS